MYSFRNTWRVLNSFQGSDFQGTGVGTIARQAAPDILNEGLGVIAKGTFTDNLTKAKSWPNRVTDLDICPGGGKLGLGFPCTALLPAAFPLSFGLNQCHLRPFAVQAGVQVVAYDFAAVGIGS